MKSLAIHRTAPHEGPEKSGPSAFWGMANRGQLIPVVQAGSDFQIRTCRAVPLLLLGGARLRQLEGERTRDQTAVGYVFRAGPALWFGRPNLEDATAVGPSRSALTRIGSDALALTRIGSRALPRNTDPDRVTFASIKEVAVT